MVPGYPRLAERHVPWGDDAVGAPARYVDALRRVDAMEAMFLPLEMDVGDAKALLARVDGLMLLGGGDLDPAHYGEERKERLYGVNDDRDACEVALARIAVAEGVPTLAICRGQLGRGPPIDNARATAAMFEVTARPI